MAAVGQVLLYHISQPLLLPLLPIETLGRYDLVCHQTLPQCSSAFTLLVLSPKSVLQSMAIEAHYNAGSWVLSTLESTDVSRTELHRHTSDLKPAYAQTKIAQGMHKLNVECSCMSTSTDQQQERHHLGHINNKKRHSTKHVLLRMLQVLLP